MLSLLPLPQAPVRWSVLTAAVLLGACSPRTTDKPAAPDSGLRAPLPATSVFAANSSEATTPFLAGYVDTGIPWQAWSQATLDKAAASNRPVLVVIGYSTCPFSRRLRTHSLQDPALTSFLKNNFVCVLVDADDNASLANLVLDFQPVLGSPPSYPAMLWVLPTGKPYHIHKFATKSGFTPEGIMESATKALKIWQSKDGYAAMLGEDTLARLAPLEKIDKQRPPMTPEIVFDRAYTVINQFFDITHGSVSSGKNFPSACQLKMALRLAEVFPEDSFRRKQLRQIVGTCLAKMRDGAIRDALDGTFHQYSEKPNWNGPHSEKSLVDQAMIASAYLDAARHLQDESFRATAFALLDTVLATWKTSSGLFRHAETAFVGEDWIGPSPFIAPWFTWSLGEINQLLDPEEAKILIHCHGIMSRGNMPPSLYMPEFKDRANVLYFASSPAETASALALPPAVVDTKIASAHAKLRAARNARPGQFIDQRTTVAGNALLLSALAEAALHPGGERFKPAAQNLKAVCCNRFVDDNFKVRASGLWQDRPLPAAPSLLDHALLIQALLDCHALAPEPTTLPRLSGLMETVRAGFADDGTGFYRVNPPSTLLPVDRPPYPFSDTAVPAANAVMAANLRRLFDLTGNQTYDLRRQSLITSFLSHRNPTLTGHTFSAEIAIAQPNRSK